MTCVKIDSNERTISEYGKQQERRKKEQRMCVNKLGTEHSRNMKGQCIGLSCLGTGLAITIKE